MAIKMKVETGTENGQNAFVVYPTYSIIDKNAYVFLFGRLKTGESFVTINKYKPYFYIEAKQKTKTEKILKEIEITGEYNIENTDAINFFGKKMSKIILTIPKDIPTIRSELENSEIKCSEADVRFEYRFMIDNNIKGTTKIIENKIINKKEYMEKILFNKNDFFVEKIFFEPDFRESWFEPKIKTLSIDIETDNYSKKIYSAAMYLYDPFENKDGKNIMENLIVYNKEIKNAISFKNEKTFLEHMVEFIKEKDPDIITGWNFIDFDIKVLNEHFKNNKIEFSIGRVNWPNRITISNDFMKESKANIPGRMVVDGISILKNNFIKLTAYKLDTAASEIIQERKLITEVENKGKEIDDMYNEQPEKLIEYNAKDAELVIKILQKNKLLELMVKRSMLTGMPLDRIQASVATLDSLYIRSARKKNIVCSSVNNNEKNAPGKGGYVMEPKAGIYSNVVVLDFKSLYPSIMMTFNIDPMSLTKKNDKFAGGIIEAPNGAFFRNEEGILPEMIREQMKHREEAKKQKDDTASYAIKIIMNSFYGALGNPGCRFFNMEISNAITYFGQYIIQNTAKEINKLGYDVIYSDTDSVFVNTKTKEGSQAEEIGHKIEKTMNEYYDNWVKKNYNRKSELYLEFEKNFMKIIFPRQRGEEKGAKKRYAGIIIKDKKEKMEFTGLEFVRRDWTELSKKFQLELLDRVFHEKPVIDFVKEFIKNVYESKYDELMVYVKGLRKNLSAYTKITPPHVKAARKLKELDSNIIKYYMTTDGPEPIQKHEHPLDYEHYIDKQIRPIADSILGFYGTSLEDITKGTTQTDLFDY